MPLEVCIDPFCIEQLYIGLPLPHAAQTNMSHHALTAKASVLTAKGRAQNDLSVRMSVSDNGEQSGKGLRLRFVKHPNLGIMQQPKREGARILGPPLQSQPAKSRSAHQHG